MIDAESVKKAKRYLETLCSVKPNRRTGSPGNRAATDFFASTVAPWDYALDTTPFPCLDFESGEASLKCGDIRFVVHISPFSQGCDVNAELVTVSTIEELERAASTDKILLMKSSVGVMI